MTRRFRSGFALLLAAMLWASAAFGWSFAVCGDSRDDTGGVFPRILAEVRDSDMEFLVHTGDLERPGGTKSWKAFRAKTADFAKPLHIAIGNHELYRSSREECSGFFGLPVADWVFRTYHQPAELLLQGRIATAKDFQVHAPWSFVLAWDRWARKREAELRQPRG